MYIQYAQILNNFNKFVQASAQAETADKAWKHLLGYLQQFHISSAMYAFVSSKYSGDPDSEVIVFTNHPIKFMEQYNKEGWAEYDVATRHCQLETQKIQLMQDPEIISTLTPEEKRVVDVARSQFNINSGLTIPLRNDNSSVQWGGIGLASNLPFTDFQTQVGTFFEHIRCAVTIFHFAAIQKPTHKDRARLTKSELNALKLASTGMNALQIAYTTKVGKETVHKHLSSARKKLAACNTAHAVAEALRLNLLHLGGPLVVPSP